MLQIKFGPTTRDKKNKEDAEREARDRIRNNNKTHHNNLYKWQIAIQIRMT